MRARNERSGARGLLVVRQIVQAECDVLRDGAMREQRVMLKQHADAAFARGNSDALSSESKRTRSFNVMRPRLGRSRPAMQRNSMDLPAPDAPRMLSGVSVARNATSSVKSASFFSIWTSRVTSVLSPALAAQALRVRPVVQTA